MILYRFRSQSRSNSANRLVVDARRAAAGHKVDTIRGLADGPERERIEAETNRRAGRPYATLSAAERSRLVSGLTGLPGEP